jgi:hypothetical protein
MSRKNILDYLGPKARAQAERLLAEQKTKPLNYGLLAYYDDGYAKPSTVLAANEVMATPSERRIRQSAVKLNQLEIDYQAVLLARYGKEQVRSQDVRLLLANGTWFKPDFFIPSEQLFIETKGPHAFRGGLENLKIAAHSHTWAKFRLVWRISGQWKFQEVLP